MNHRMWKSAGYIQILFYLKFTIQAMKSDIRRILNVHNVLIR